MFSEARTIHDFILRHKSIRRFDFSQCISWIEEDEPKENLDDNAMWFSSILDAVCSLENVTALGLTFPALEISDTEDALFRLTTCDALKTCKALRLSGITNVPLWDWTFEFPRFTFLALFNRLPEQWTNTFYALAPPEHPSVSQRHSPRAALSAWLNIGQSIHQSRWEERYEDDKSYYYDEDEEDTQEDTEDEWTTVDEDEEVHDVVEYEEDGADDNDDIGGPIVN
ncbi:hypothetical protein ACEPAF_1169 [Sanghuangporus sanghuang]